jgi:ABC-type transport system involved in multi-copper enzyme maturation permease subunit
VLVSALVIYSAGGFLFAWWLFLRAQDVQWTGGTIALPGWLRVPRLFVRTKAQQGRRPRAALLAKEFQLHQSQLVIAGVLALLHLGVIATRKLGGGFKDSPVLEIVLAGFWGLWFVMPLLIGCAAVAEERKLGTWEGQLCLPASRRTQFTVKFVVALLLAVLLGAVVPLLFEGSRILPNIQYDFSRSFNDRDVLMPGGIFIQTVMIILEEVSVPLPFLALAGLAAAVAAIAFYASTLARNTLQALAPAVLGFVVTWALLLGAYRVEDLVGYPLWRGWLVYFLGVPVMTLTLAWLAGWNFKHALVGWNVWRRNVLAFLT